VFTAAGYADVQPRVRGGLPRWRGRRRPSASAPRTSCLNTSTCCCA
jgi:hypothetical protein